MNDDENKVIGRAKGGVRRAEVLSAEQKKEIAKKAATARWGARPFRVFRSGNFLEKFGIDVDCYVLDDPQKTAVISKRGMGEAIGFSRRGDRLTAFINSQAMENMIGRELREKIENPIVFQRLGSAAENPISDTTHGYDVTILVDICEAVLTAFRAGKLKGIRYQAMIKQAQIILSASARNGMKQLVYALAGYSPTSEEVIEAFKLYVREEAKKYEAEFPNEIYIQWHRLYNIPVPVRGKPWQFKHLTIKHIYYPLAKSSGKLLTLMRALRDQDGEKRKKKLFQFLNDLGARALRIHLGRVLEMAESSLEQSAYEKRINDRFGDQPELDFVIASETTASPPPS